MFPRKTIYLLSAVFALSLCSLAQEAQPTPLRSLAVSHEGRFEASPQKPLNTAATVFVNTPDPQALWNWAHANGNGTMNGLISAITVPPNVGIGGANALMAIAGSSTANAEVTAAQFQGTALANGVIVWGANSVATDKVGLTSGVSLIGDEIDIEPNNLVGTYSTVTGLWLVIGGQIGRAQNSPAYGNAIKLSPAKGGTQWVNGLFTEDGSVAANGFAIDLGTANRRDDSPSPSQQIGLYYRDASNKKRAVILAADSSGDLVANVSSSLVVTDNHIGQSRANGDLAGTITISGSNRGFHEFSQAFNHPPLCQLTPSSDPGFVGAWWVTTTTSGLTANVQRSGNITFSYSCVGNPN